MRKVPPNVGIVLQSCTAASQLTQQAGGANEPAPPEGGPERVTLSGAGPAPGQRGAGIEGRVPAACPTPGQRRLRRRGVAARAPGPGPGSAETGPAARRQTASGEERGGWRGRRGGGGGALLGLLGPTPGRVGRSAAATPARRRRRRRGRRKRSGEIRGAPARAAVGSGPGRPARRCRGRERSPLHA